MDFSKPCCNIKRNLCALRKTYCGSIGIEYMHILQLEEVDWIQKRMEKGWLSFNFSSRRKIAYSGSSGCRRWIRKIYWF